MSFEYGKVATLTPLIRRVIARNPSAFTFHGTGTYIIGKGQVAIVDPGPDMTEHVDALLDAIRGETVTHILVTHTHIDHSPACRAVQAATGAPTYGFGPHGSGRHEQGEKVEEGGDQSFDPDHQVRHGDVVTGRGWSVEAVHTPGHTSNHICFGLREEQALFSGDHVMGWSTSIISPPDGDMAAYMRSLELLLQRDDKLYWPTHGTAIRDPKPFVKAFIAHRREREQQVLACLAGGIDRIVDMVPGMYKDVPVSLHRAAARSVFATMLHLVEQGVVTCDGPPSVDARYRLKQ
ncbi:MAG: MBL fold metallo-hydrolase [Alphaproteobacteria bacterium]